MTKLSTRHNSKDRWAIKSHEYRVDTLKPGTFTTCHTKMQLGYITPAV